MTESHVTLHAAADVELRRPCRFEVDSFSSRRFESARNPLYEIRLHKSDSCAVLYVHIIGRVAVAVSLRGRGERVSSYLTVRQSWG